MIDYLSILNSIMGTGAVIMIATILYHVGKLVKQVETLSKDVHAIKNELAVTSDKVIRLETIEERNHGQIQ